MRARRVGTRKVVVEVVVDDGGGRGATAEAAARHRPVSAPGTSSNGSSAAPPAAPRHFGAALVAAAPGAAAGVGAFRVTLQVAHDVTWKRLALSAAQRFSNGPATGAGQATRAGAFSHGGRQATGALGGGHDLLPVNVSALGPGRASADFLHPDEFVCYGDYSIDKVGESSGAHGCHRPKGTKGHRATAPGEGSGTQRPWLPISLQYSCVPQPQTPLPPPRLRLKPRLRPRLKPKRMAVPQS